MQDFHTVYARNIGRVYRLCRLRLGNREDAEDAVQNIFLRWLRAGTEFASEEHEKAYFLRAAHNECVNIKQSFWRIHRVSFEELPPGMDVSEDNTGNIDGGTILCGLPAKYREVLYLRLHLVIMRKLPETGV